MIKLIYFLSLVFSFSAFSSVWDVTKSWSDEEEEKYSKWIESEYHVDYFIEPSSPYYLIPHDCADAVYIARMIYAYENQLPFSIYSSKWKRIISNDMKRWDRNPDKYLDQSLAGIKSVEIIRAIKDYWPNFSDQQKKFFHFARYVSVAKTTWNVHEDTFPSKLGKGNIRPGIVFLIRRYHTFMVKEVDVFGNILLVNSTTPASIRRLDKDYTVYPAFSVPYEEGYLTFRWPNELKRPSHKVNRKSLQQYRLFKKSISDSLNEKYPNPKKINVKEVSKEDKYFALQLFNEYMKNGIEDTYVGNFNGLASEEESIVSSFMRLLDDICNTAKSRVDYVNEALAYKKHISNRCMNSGEYYNYSTPSRDARIINKVRDIYSLYLYIAENINGPIKDQLNTDSKNAIGNFVYFLNNLEKRKVGDAYHKSSCEINFSKDQKPMNLFLFLNLLSLGKVSSDPNQSLDSRWGLETEENNCKKY